jgi:peptidoglycan/LPS O-acetylase OafA/YrhL
MNLRRLRAGEWITALAGLVLLASLFLPWYGSPGATGWEALTVNDVLLAAVGVFALALFFVTAHQPVPALPIALDALVTLAGMVAVALVLVRVGFPPGEPGSREWGLWLALAAALGVTVGGWISMRDQRLSRPGRPSDLSGQPVTEPAEVEVVSPPGPHGAASQ